MSHNKPVLPVEPNALSPLAEWRRYADDLASLDQEEPAVSAALNKALNHIDLMESSEDVSPGAVDRRERDDMPASLFPLVADLYWTACEVCNASEYKQGHKVGASPDTISEVRTHHIEALSRTVKAFQAAGPAFIARLDAFIEAQLLERYRTDPVFRTAMGPTFLGHKANDVEQAADAGTA